MIDLEAINDRLEAVKTHSDHPVFHAVLLDAWALLDEVERTRNTLRELLVTIPPCSCHIDGRDDCMPPSMYVALIAAQNLLNPRLQSCGHPRSAIVTADDLGGDGTSYCGMCNAEAEAEVRRDDAMADRPHREPYSGDLDMDPDMREQMERY